MCMILDINMYGLFFKDNLDMKPIHEWLNKTGKLVYSNHAKIEEEIQKGIRSKFNELSRAGKVKRISKIDVEKEIQKIRRSNYNLKSDDSHILGLAQASGAKLLCTSDEYLQEDFKKLFGKKRSIYKNKNHKHLLRKDTCP